MVKETVILKSVFANNCTLNSSNEQLELDRFSAAYDKGITFNIKKTEIDDVPAAVPAPGNQSH